MKVGFIYYNFFPVTGGASVHGYYLARELSKLGFKLYKLNGEPDPYTIKHSNPVYGAFKILRDCKIIYARIDYFINLRNLFTLVALLVGKKVIVEVNSPSDELKLFGKSGRYILTVDRIIKRVLKKAEAVIAVSESVKEYCRNALDLSNVYVVENGGEPVQVRKESVSVEIIDQMNSITSNYSKRLLWSGSLNSMQDLELVKEIASCDDKNLALIMIVKSENNSVLPESNRENLFVFRDLDRSDVEYILSECQAGLALYGDYSWCRWGFYNSSLKIFEYLNNGLLTISNKPGTTIQSAYPNFREVKNVQEILTLTDSLPANKPTPGSMRTWADVGRETAEVLNKTDS